MNPTLSAVGAGAGAAAAPGPTPAAVEVAGYVEAVGAVAVLGWAWSPREPAARVVVELRLGAEVLASGVADAMREDLARNGIGDGRHAFRLEMPEAARARVAELRVTGRVDDGAPVPLGLPPMAEALSERLDRMQRGMDMVVASQRVLHRNLQAALTQAPNGQGGDTGRDATTTLGELASERGALAEQIRVLEIFVLRLDERLAALAAPAVVLRPALVSGRVAAALGLGAVLLLGACGLYRSLAG